MILETEIQDILTVATLCGIRTETRGSNANRTLAYCPFCQCTRATMYLNTGGNYVNTFKCQKCGESGNSITLFAKLKGVSNKEAYKSLIVGNNSFRNIPNRNVSKTNVKSTKEIKIQNTTADASYTDIVYRELLKNLTLKEAHKKNLLNRGLSIEKIENAQYKSVPEFNERTMICNKLKRYDLRRVPGFTYNDDRGWSFVGRKGFFIPIKDEMGRITSLQIRSDDIEKWKCEQRGKKFSRYTFFSDGSIPIINSVHVVGNIKSNNRIWVTEGPLKADIFNHITGECIIALPGVNSGHKKIIELLKESNADIIMSFDMDIVDNIYVKKAFMSLVAELKKYTNRVYIKTWENVYKKYNVKGLDDYVVFLKRQGKLRDFYS